MMLSRRTVGLLAGVVSLAAFAGKANAQLVTLAGTSIPQQTQNFSTGSPAFGYNLTSMISGVDFQSNVFGGLYDPRNVTFTIDNGAGVPLTLTTLNINENRITAAGAVRQDIEGVYTAGVLRITDTNTSELLLVGTFTNLRSTIRYITQSGVPGNQFNGITPVGQFESFPGGTSGDLSGQAVFDNLIYTGGSLVANQVIPASGTNKVDITTSFVRFNSAGVGILDSSSAPGGANNFSSNLRNFQDGFTFTLQSQNPVPEPAEWAVIGMALAGAGTLMVRARRKGMNLA